ncbi:MAG: preprotein translocase subunit SecY [Erysipelotrichaceae bacterium]|nr:preprotein translocase subunit SecY [Erysipelotrichaceae bacterium]
MFKKVIEAFKNKDIRQRILFTLGVLFIYKLGTTITVPRVTLGANFLESAGSFAQLMDILSGGSLSQFSIFALGVSPYITASIITDILSSDNMLPALAELKKEGEQGRKKIESINKYLSLMFCVIQGYGMLRTLGLHETLSFADIVYVVSIITAGSCFVVWLGDQISVKGIGNGISVIIFAGIVSTMPKQIIDAFNTFLPNGMVNDAVFSGLLKFSIYIIAYLAIIAFVVFMEKSIRKIPLQYSTNTTQINMKKDISFLPIKINSSGVLPVIYANSLMMAVILITGFFGDNEAITEICSLGVKYKGVYWGTIIYAVLIVLFAYYQSNAQVRPQETSEDLQKSNAYIPGIRPGKDTSAHISRVLSRVTFLGMFGLLIIALLPSLLPIIFTDLDAAIAFGGTGLIIVVGVVNEVNTQIESKLNTKQYKGFSY